MTTISKRDLLHSADVWHSTVGGLDGCSAHVAAATFNDGETARALEYGCKRQISKDDGG